MNKLLSPHEAATQLQANPTAAAAILARLDIEACRFVPTVDSAGKTPLVETGMAGFGQPMSGCLAFSGAEVAALHQAGQRAILVCDGHESKDGIKDDQPRPNGLLIASATSQNQSVWFNSHFLVNAAYERCVLIDHNKKPSLRLDIRQATLTTDNNTILASGDEVTIAPALGQLWLGHKEIKPVPDYVLALQTALRHVFGQIAQPHIAYHMQTHADMVTRTEFTRRNKLDDRIGLYRTEDSLRFFLHAEPQESANPLTTLLAGVVPRKLNFWEDHAFQDDIHMTYRLVDLHGVNDLLPDNIAAGLTKGDDHCPDTNTFLLRRYLYRFQMEQVLNSWGKFPFNRRNPKDIIIPAVMTANEVGIFKNLVMDKVGKLVPPHSRQLVHFGVMIETAEAVANIAQIAPLCDTLCFGTNDLTAAFTNLSRRQLDHSAWMRERGYRGRSPFEVLVPEVSGPMAEAIQTARAVNPAVQINVCGYQIGGHNLPSQLAVLKMGVDCLTVPPTPDSVLRTQAAIIRHKAGLAPV